MLRPVQLANDALLEDACSAAPSTRPVIRHLRRADAGGTRRLDRRGVAVRRRELPAVGLVLPAGRLAQTIAKAAWHDPGDTERRRLTQNYTRSYASTLATSSDVTNAAATPASWSTPSTSP